MKLFFAEKTETEIFVVVNTEHPIYKALQNPYYHFDSAIEQNLALNKAMNDGFENLKNTLGYSQIAIASGDNIRRLQLHTGVTTHLDFKSIEDLNLRYKKNGVKMTEEEIASFKENLKIEFLKIENIDFSKFFKNAFSLFQKIEKFYE